MTHNIMIKLRIRVNHAIIFVKLALEKPIENALHAKMIIFMMQHIMNAYLKLRSYPLFLITLA